jgi:hypothetical protein
MISKRKMILEAYKWRDKIKKEKEEELYCIIYSFIIIYIVLCQLFVMYCLYYNILPDKIIKNKKVLNFLFN